MLSLNSNINPHIEGFEDRIRDNLHLIRDTENLLQLSASNLRTKFTNGTTDYTSDTYPATFMTSSDYMVSNFIDISNTDVYSVVAPVQLINNTSLVYKMVEYDANKKNGKLVANFTWGDISKASGHQMHTNKTDGSHWLRIQAPYQPGNQLMVTYSKYTMEYHPNAIDLAVGFNDQPNLLNHTENFNSWNVSAYADGGEILTTGSHFGSRTAFHAFKQNAALWSADPVTLIPNHTYVGSIWGCHAGYDYGGNTGNIQFVTSHTASGNIYWNITETTTFSYTPRLYYSTYVAKPTDLLGDISQNFTIFDSSTAFGGGSHYLYLPMIQEGAVPSSYTS